MHPLQHKEACLQYHNFYLQNFVHPQFSSSEEGSPTEAGWPVGPIVGDAPSGSFLDGVAGRGL